MIQFKENAQTDGRTDGRTDRRTDRQTLFCRTLLATAVGQKKKKILEKIFSQVYGLCSVTTYPLSKFQAI